MHASGPLTPLYESILSEIAKVQQLPAFSEVQ